MNAIRNASRAVRIVRSGPALWGALIGCACNFALGQGAEVALGSSQVRISRLGPDQTLTTEAIVIDDCANVFIQVTATRDDVSVSVVTPDEHVLDATTIGTVNGQYFECEGGTGDGPIQSPLGRPGYHYMFRFPATNAGTYLLRFEAAPGLDEDVAVISAVTTDSELGVAIIVPEPIVPATSTVVISVAVFEATSPVQTAIVGARIKAVDSTDPEANLTLHDGGGDGDAEAGDGLYSGIYTPTRLGPHYVVAEISGTRADATPFARQVATRFEVVSTGASRFGNPTDTGIDADGNGFFEYIEFSQIVNATATGSYGLRVWLKTVNGTDLSALGYTTLEDTGYQMLKARIRAAEILRAVENGPYSVVRVEMTRLQSGMGHVPIDRAVIDPPLATDAYLLTQFERPAIQFVGLASDSGIDTDSDGKFDTLRAIATVNVRTGGTFKVSAQVADGCNRRIAWADGQQVLTANEPQSVVLDFSGEKIGQRGVAGPYKVRAMTITRLGATPPESLLVQTVGETGYYLASAFEGYTSGSADCNANGQPDDCECLGDMNGDRQISIQDQAIFLSSFGLCEGQSGFNQAADYDGDGCVSLTDFTCFLGRFGMTCP